MSNDYVKDFKEINDHQLIYSDTSDNDNYYLADFDGWLTNDYFTTEWFNWQYLKGVTNETN